MTTKTQLIKETPQYQGTTSNIVKDIFKVIKQNITEEKQKTYYLPEELDLDKIFYDAGYGTGVSVELTIKRDTDMEEPFLVDAMYVPEEEIIEIIIQLNPFEEPKSYAPLYQDLMEDVRHELEHFDQEYKGTLPDAEEGLGTMEYYSQPHEVEAQGAGLNLKAKKTRQGYEKVVGDSIELTKQRYGLSDEEGNDLYNLIVNDIEERYGKKELKEHDASRENKESLIVSMNNYFNPPKYKGVCEIKAYLSDEYTGIEPIKVTIIYDKNYLPLNTRTFPPYSSEIDDISDDVQEDLKTLFGIQLWKIGVGLAECESDYSVLYEQDESFNARGHTVFEDDEYKVWTALDKKSFCEFARDTKWCEEKVMGGVSTLNVWDRMYKGGSSGTYYFIKNKSSGELHLVADFSKIPLLREGKLGAVYNTEGVALDKYSFFSDIPQLRKLFDLDYSMQQRIQYEMPFTTEETKEWYEKDTTPLTTIVYNLVQGKDIEENREKLYEFLGDDLDGTDRYHYRPAPDIGKGQIEVTEEGILLFMNEEDYIHNVLCISEDDDYYYQSVHSGYGDDYEEMDSDELQYMSCWFGPEVMELVYALREKLGAPQRSACSDFEDGEFNDFFEAHFPKEWGDTADDLLTSVGYGVGRNRREEMERYLESTIFIKSTNEGSGAVSIFLPYPELLYHLTHHHIEDLSQLMAEDKCIGEIEGALSDIWYDSWDWAEGTHEEMDSTMMEFLDKLEESDLSLDERKKRKDNYEKVIKDLNFKPSEAYGATYQFLQPWEGGNKIKVRYYNVDNDTVDLFINTPGLSHRNIPVDNIALEELVKFTQPTLFDDVWEGLGKGFS